jgi:hypothetical protein
MPCRRLRRTISRVSISIMGQVSSLCSHVLVMPAPRLKYPLDRRLFHLIGVFNANLHTWATLAAGLLSF